MTSADVSTPPLLYDTCVELATLITDSPDSDRIAFLAERIFHAAAHHPPMTRRQAARFEAELRAYAGALT